MGRCQPCKPLLRNATPSICCPSPNTLVEAHVKHVPILPVLPHVTLLQVCTLALLKQRMQNHSWRVKHVGCLPVVKALKLHFWLQCPLAFVHKNMQELLRVDNICCETLCTH